MLNVGLTSVVQHLINGRLEDKRVGRYAIICGRSPQDTCHCEGVKRPSQSHNIIEPHPTPLLSKEREQENLLSPRERVRERADFGSPAGKRSGSQAGYVILNLVQNLLNNGRLEDRKVRRYAVIGEHSSQDILCPPPETLPNKRLSIVCERETKSVISRRGLNNGSPSALVSYHLKRSPLTLALSRKGRGNDINSPKRTYSPIDLLTYSLKKTLTAFTLAEVLITLGIIGVVAAITIPTLVSKFQMKSFETAFKKQYSVFQNAINYTVLENGISQCYIFYPDAGYHAQQQDCVALKESLVDLLKLTLIELDYSKYNLALKSEVLADGGKAVNSACGIDSYRTDSPDNYITKDGTIVTLYLKSNRFPAIIFDVNGLKGPNKWGYDVFYMTLSKRDRNGSLDQKLFLTDEYCSIVEKGGRLPRTILQNKEKTENSDFSIFW